MPGNTPFFDIPRGAAERVGITPLRAGLAFLVLTVIVVYFAFSKANPLADPYELNAIFENTNELKPRSPVRVAGVDVGKVREVEPIAGSDKAHVKMVIEDKGLPIHEDAELKVRSRIFLEGNYFVELKPGTPSAPTIDSGHTLPASQTFSPVQTGQVLTALQTDTREDLKRFLREYAKGFEGKGSRGLNEAIHYWEDAYRNTAMSTRATLGTEPHDLTKVLKGQGKVFGALSRDEEALKLLVVSLNRLAAAFARQDDNLRATIPQLRDVLKVGQPALASLNEAFPTLRAFARDALPAARSSSPTLDAQIPFITQARQLVARRELGGLVAELRPTVPQLALLNTRSARTLQQTRELASCQNNVLLPFSKTPIPDPDFPANSGQPFYKQSPRALVGLAGESRIVDADSPLFRVLAGGGPTTLVSTGETGDQLFAPLDYPLDGVRPARPLKRPVFRPDVACETQEAPDLHAVLGEPDQTTTAKPAITPEYLKIQEEAKEELAQVAVHLKRQAAGLPTFDPLDYSELGERLQAKRLGLKLGENGAIVGERKDAGR
ncbi:MAG TPA: MlaD family protein [Thermoleophilaceae bacterium]|jgi:virulence factor Mce-like protein